MTDTTSDPYDRARTALKLLGTPKPGEPGKDGVQEGEHYTVVAYTDYLDMFVPTVVQWNHGELDMFTDVDESRENKERALRE